MIIEANSHLFFLFFIYFFIFIIFPFLVSASFLDTTLLEIICDVREEHHQP